ncbi:MAG TPA: tRNA epoxyqueuosine(34) reductase QueG [Bacteroidales bacterium]|nr:tRNA epoxyqueuosine(34) reductase QueG [Bacteroidales bacterium]
MTTTELSQFIRTHAGLLGFQSFGFAQAAPLPEQDKIHFKTWLNSGFQGEMTYLERNLDKRLDPTLLVEGCKSVVIVALNYYPSERQSPSAPKIAKFAYGLDYHYIIRGKLNRILEKIREQGVTVNGRAFSDSAPLMERYWAWKAGLGWLGKNQNLILPGCGSYFLLGELLIDLELDYGMPMESHCGTCNKCHQACPTKAFDKNCIDARRCLSYLTIEKKGSFSNLESKMVGENDWIFGCDICQDVCPWNRFAQATTISELQPTEHFLILDEAKIQKLNPASFKTYFSGTCIERTGLEGLHRNLAAK